MCSPVIQHYHAVLLPILSTLDNKTCFELTEAIKEIDYLIEILCHYELSQTEQQETELAYWAWWEKLRNKISP